MPAEPGATIEQLERQLQACAAELRHQQAQRAALLDGALDCIISMDSTGNIIEFNRTAEQTFGYTSAQAVGRNLADLIIPERLRASHHHGLQQRLLTGCGPIVGRRIEVDAMRADGAEFPVELAVMRSELDGKIVFTGFLRDISARRRAESALREGEQRLQFAIEGAGDGAWDCNLVTGKILSTRRSKEVLGYSDDDFGNDIEGWFALIHPDDVDRVRADALRVAAGEVPSYTSEHRQRCKDGSWKWLLTRGMVIERDSSGKPLRIAGTQTDITERKHAEATLQRTTQLLETAQAMARVGGWEVDLVNNTLFWTDQTYRIFDTSPQQYTPTVASAIDFYAAGGADKVRAALGNAINSGKALGMEMEMITATGRKIWVQITSRLTLQNDRVVKITGAFQDITRRKQIETELRELNDNLEERVAVRTRELAVAKDMAEAANHAKSDFIANMSHEIRTPMNGVLGMAELLLDSALDPTQRRYANTIKSSGKTLLTVINDILDFSKVEAGKLTLNKQPFDLSELVEEIITPYRIDSNARVKLVASVAPETPVRLFGDPIRLQQIIANLLNNAFKFTERGEVRLRIEASHIEPEHLQLSCTVSDTGIGIDAAGRQRLFQPFSQIDNSNRRRLGGTGLGLVICQRLVQMMDGEIALAREHERGSTFHFHVWLQRDLTPLPQREREPVSLRDKHLLAIDDDDDYLCILREQATALGMKVTTVLQPQQALTAARAEQPDMITIDLDMPGSDGFALDREFAAAADVAAIPRILLTASCIAPGSQQMHGSGFDAAYGKPTSIQQLRHILTATLLGEHQQRIDEPSVTAHYTGARILVAEDNAVNQQVVGAMLERFGVTAEFAGDGAQALALVKQQQYDLILMDCEMPVLDGYSATQLIRQFESAANRTATAIVALSAHALPEYRQRSLVVGMNEHVAKPISLAVLRDILARFVQVAR